MSNTLEVLKRIVREEYQDIMDGVNVHPNGFRDYTKEKNSDFDEPHSTEKMESVNEGTCCDSCNEGKICCSITEKVNEELMNENPGAAAAAAMAAIQVHNAHGKKIKASSALRSSDPATKRKAVSIFKRLKDKFKKKEDKPVDKVAQYRALTRNKGDYQRESVNEGGMGILDSDQADILQGIVMRNKNKSLKSLLSVVLKSGYFKGVDKKELLGYIDGARQFVKYMKSHPMESVKLTKTRIKEIIREEIQTVLTEGTRWSVGIETPGGKIASTYGHWDGYPEHAGKMLKKYYSNTGKVKQLLKLGKQGISSIEKSMKGGKDHSFDNPKKGETVFYGRDRGEKDNFSNTWKNRDVVKFNSGEEYFYIWNVKDKKWYYKSRYSNPQDWTELK